ncbi:MAG TPA: universal stress protein [Actinomycetota bacterium]
MAYKRIVVATDGSPSAETAEHVAATLARAINGRLTVAHAFTTASKAEASVARALRIAEREGVKTKVVTSGETPGHAIVEVADRESAELIVMGSRGLFKAEQVIGSVARRVATHAPCDVLLTRERPESARPHGAVPYRRILIATDGSATADRAARTGSALARQLGASVTLCFVGHPRTGELVLTDTAATIGEGEPVGMLILEGEPARMIMEAAEREGLDLIVVGNKGMTGARALLLGSIPKEIAEEASTDVLIARTVTQNLSEIGRGEGGIVTVGDHKVAVYRAQNGALTTVSATCTHMGCTVRWNPAQATWDCPCHGSRFAPTGEVLNGPADKPLPATTL